MAARPPSLRTIAAFEAAARHENFSKAASELNLTQGAVSHAIQTLEARLGVKLFERERRRLVLTEPGRTFAGQVRLSLGLLSKAFESRPWLRKDRLNITALPVFARRILGPRLLKLREAFPNLEIHITSSWKLDDIRTQDLGLRYGPGGWAGLSAVKIADEVMIAVASPSYAREGLHDPKDLLNRDLLGHPEFPWAPWLNVAGLDIVDEPRVKLVLNDSDLLIDAAVGGVGIALVRSALVHTELAQGTLVKLFDIEQQAPYSYWVVWNPASPKIDLIKDFRKWVALEMSVYSA